MAESISQHNFSQRFNIKKTKKNEFDLLGQAFNKMAEQIELQYQLLEKRVTEKTAELQQINKILSFQYQAIKQLHTSDPLCERSIIDGIIKLAPLGESTTLQNIRRFSDSVLTC